jgi:hypothetical protein
MLIFASSSLLAQDTDTIPKKDTTKKDTVSLVNKVQMNSVMKHISENSTKILQSETVFALPSKAINISPLKEVTTSA